MAIKLIISDLHVDDHKAHMMRPEAWDTIQNDIWDCNACKDIPEVCLNIRQQTVKPTVDTKLLVVGIAPPYMPGVNKKTAALSATNNPKDNLRNFVETTLDLPWDHLASHGLAMLHGTKCAIRRDGRYQNPSTIVVDSCAPLHFYREFLLTKPPIVLTFGDRARRAVLKMPGIQRPRELRLTGPCTGQFNLRIGELFFHLFATPFFSVDPAKASADLKIAASQAGIIQFSD